MRPIHATLLKMQLRSEEKGKKTVSNRKNIVPPNYLSLRSPFLFFTPTPISFSFILQCGAWSQGKLHSEVKPAVKRRPHPIACHFLRGSHRLLKGAVRPITVHFQIWEAQYFARDLAPEKTSERISKVEDLIMLLEQTTQLTGAPDENIVKRIVNVLGFFAILVLKGITFKLRVTNIRNNKHIV